MLKSDLSTFQLHTHHADRRILVKSMAIKTQIFHGYNVVNKNIFHHLPSSIPWKKFAFISKWYVQSSVTRQQLNGGIQWAKQLPLSAICPLLKWLSDMNHFAVLDCHRRWLASTPSIVYTKSTETDSWSWVSLKSITKPKACEWHHWQVQRALSSLILDLLRECVSEAAAMFLKSTGQWPTREV